MFAGGNYGLHLRWLSYTGGGGFFLNLHFTPGTGNRDAEAQTTHALRIHLFLNLQIAPLAVHLILIHPIKISDEIYQFWIHPINVSVSINIRHVLQHAILIRVMV